MAADGGTTPSDSKGGEESARRLMDLLRLRRYLKPATAEAVDKASYVAVLQKEVRTEWTYFGQAGGPSVSRKMKEKI